MEDTKPKRGRGRPPKNKNSSGAVAASPGPGTEAAIQRKQAIEREPAKRSIDVAAEGWIADAEAEKRNDKFVRDLCENCDDPAVISCSHCSARLCETHSRGICPKSPSQMYPRHVIAAERPNPETPADNAAKDVIVDDDPEYMPDKIFNGAVEFLKGEGKPTGPDPFEDFRYRTTFTVSESLPGIGRDNAVGHLADLFVASGYWPGLTAARIAVTILAGESLGLSPVRSVFDLTIVDNPSGPKIAWTRDLPFQTAEDRQTDILIAETVRDIPGPIVPPPATPGKTIQFPTTGGTFTVSDVPPPYHKEANSGPVLKPEGEDDAKGGSVDLDATDAAGYAMAPGSGEWPTLKYEVSGVALDVNDNPSGLSDDQVGEMADALSEYARSGIPLGTIIHAVIDPIIAAGIDGAPDVNDNPSDLSVGEMVDGVGTMIDGINVDSINPASAFGLAPDSEVVGASKDGSLRFRRRDDTVEIWRTGYGAPNYSIGNDGDFYFDRSTSCRFEKVQGSYSMTQRPSPWTPIDDGHAEAIKHGDRPADLPGEDFGADNAAEDVTRSDNAANDVTVPAVDPIDDATLSLSWRTSIGNILRELGKDPAAKWHEFDAADMATRRAMFDKANEWYWQKVRDVRAAVILALESDGKANREQQKGFFLYAEVNADPDLWDLAEAKKAAAAIEHFIK